MLCKGHTTLLLCAHATTAALLPIQWLKVVVSFLVSGWCQRVMLLIHSREPYTTFSEEMGAGLFKRRILTKYQSTSHYTRSWLQRCIRAHAVWDWWGGMRKRLSWVYYISYKSVCRRLYIMQQTGGLCLSLPAFWHSITMPCLMSHDLPSSLTAGLLFPLPSPFAMPSYWE